MIMAKKATDAECEANYIKLRELFDKVVPDANRFTIVYGCGVDVGMMDYVVVRTTTYTYTSYIIGFDADSIEIVILPFDRDMESYGKPIYQKKSDIESAKMGWLSKEITIRDNRLPKKYIQFSVPATINEDEDQVAVVIKQETQHKQFVDFFKNKFAKK